MANSLAIVWEESPDVVAYDFSLDYSFTFILPHRIVFVEPIFQVQFFFGSYTHPFDCELIEIARMKHLLDSVA